MYLLGTQTKIEWVLDITPNTILITELFVITVQPNGSTDIVQVSNLIAPTSTEQGLVSNLITPDSIGLWELSLVKGTVDDYVTLSTTMLYVFDNDTVVNSVTDPVTGNPITLDLIGV